MDIYIFGAGASFASQQHLLQTEPIYIPPITNNLFSEEYLYIAGERHLDVEDIIGELREEYIVSNKGFEDFLTAKWSHLQALQSTHVIKSEQRKLGIIAFYIWRLLQLCSARSKPGNLYHQFTAQLRNRPQEHVIVNFNYDTLLDRAYGHYFEPLDSLSAYTRNNYFKPHGSVNWLLKPRLGEVDSDVFDHRNSTDYRERLVRATSNMFSKDPIPLSLKIYTPTDNKLNNLTLLGDQDFSYAFFYPMIMLPLTSKMYSQVPKFKESIVDKATEKIREAENIFLIGYRASDQIIYDLLDQVEPNTKLHVISKSTEEDNDPSSDIFDRVKDFRRFTRGELTTNEGFEHFIKKL